MLSLVFTDAVSGAAHRHASHPAAPVLTFVSGAIAVSGLTPRANVILFAVDREAVPYDVSVRNHTMVQRADEDGATRFELKKPLSDWAIVAVVDGTSGRYAIESPAPVPLRLRVFPSGFLKKKDADYMFADLDLTWVEAICVRPGRGAWQMFVVDGAGFDADGLSDGRTVVDAQQMKRLAGEDESPLRFHRRDVVIVIDPRSMSVMATEVPE